MRTIREFPAGAKEFWFRVIVVPFEVAMAITAAWSGVAGLMDLTVTANAFNATLPHWAHTGFNLLYVVSGFSVTAGVGWGYKNLEGFGLTLMLSGLMVRAFTLYTILGMVPVTVNVLMQAFFFGGACFVRLLLLLQKKNTIVVTLDTDAVEILPLKDVTHDGSLR